MLAEFLPGVPALLAEERAQLQGAALTTAMLVRIPFGTALFEEFVFRGVLLAVFLGGTTPTVAAGVAVTTAAGLVFTWRRWSSDSLLAPVLAHWATNALGLLAAATSSSPA